jgi:hypothetical protein
MLFKVAQGALNDAVNLLGQNIYNVKSTAEVSVTLTTTEFIDAVYIQTGTPGAANKTTPTAAAIVAAIRGAAVGSVFDFWLDNGGDNTITIVAGAGVTLSGTATCATTKNKRFTGVVTNIGAATEAVRVICGAQLV